MSVVRPLLWLGFVVIVTGCPRAPYLTASGEFAEATHAGTAGLSPVFDAASDLCRRRAQLDYLVHRLETSNERFWRDYYAKATFPVPQSDGTTRELTWKQHCELLQRGDDLLRKGLDALSNYADALKQIAGEDYTGKDFSSLAQDATDLGHSIAGNSASSKASDIMKAISDPIGKLVGVLLQGYAEGQVKDIVKRADPSVSAILDSLQRYTQATVEEARDATDKLEQSLNDSDKKLAPDSLQILQFYEIATRWETDLHTATKAQEGMLEIVGKLRKAESALVSAADKDDQSNRDDLKKVVGYASEVVKQLQALKSAINGKDAS